jgi:hypothetical protein
MLCTCRESLRLKCQHINPSELFSAVVVLRPRELFGYIQQRCECYVVVQYAACITRIYIRPHAEYTPGL